jgi:ATP/maltotriose-dependent transcriptional regulator MalT/ActR/RegA family two-component response regulator
MAEKIGVLLVDDHPMMLKGLRALIDIEENFYVAGEAADGEEAINQMRRLKPDIVVMDINMPRLNGIEATRQIIEEFPKTKILALSVHAGRKYVEEMFAAGVNGYLLKVSAPEELILALNTLQQGKIYVTAEITDIVLAKLQGHETEPKDTFDFEAMRENWLRPKLPDSVVHREELLERLERGCNKQLTLLVAPQGYGKTTLVSDWLDQYHKPFLWWSLDAKDNELQRFLLHWTQGTGKLLLDEERHLKKMLSAAKLPPVSILAGAMSAEIQAISKSRIIILDNFYHLHEKSILDLLSLVIQGGNENKHLVLISRNDPFLPLAPLRSNNALQEIRTEDMKFTTQEVKKFLEDNLGRSIDEDMAQHWEERTEGWVAGLQLALQNLKQDDSQGTLEKETDQTNWREVFTNREYDVLLMLSKRFRDKEIAESLCISPETVRSHLKNIYSKLHATNRREAIVKAEQLGYLK